MRGRLSLICHGSTAANRSGRFPVDEPLEERATGQAQSMAAWFGTVDRVWMSPALRARETSEILGLSGIVEPALRECDYGRWQGRTILDLHETEPDGFALWVTDMDAAPHGGEALSAMLARVGSWMDDHIGDEGHSIAVTHATVIRAAILNVLKADSSSFWSIDVEPLGMVEMTSDGRRWQLRFPNVAR